MLVRILWAMFGAGFTIVALSCTLILPALGILVGLALMIAPLTLGLMAAVERTTK